MTDPDDDDARELRHAREQSAASREIIAALGRSAANPGAVLDTVIESAAHLCGARAAQLFVRDGEVFRLSRVAGETPEDYRDYLLDHPIAGNRSSTVGRAAEDKCTVQIPDVLADADYGRHDLQRLAGFRTLLSTPMMLQDEVVGVLSLWRNEVAPFGVHERELLEEFAAQGAIVLRQVDLTRALEFRGDELADKVAQLEALREVDDAVGSTLDLDEVLERIVSNAVRLTNLGFGDITLGTDGGSILEYDLATDSFGVRGAFGSSPDRPEQLRAVTIHRESLVGRAAFSHSPLEIADISEVEFDPYLDVVYGEGWRSLLAVPMLRGDNLLGVLVIRRRGTGSFPPDVIEMLQTFAGQSALAIVNANLYGDLKRLHETIRHQADELATWNAELESRVAEQVAELERTSRLRHFLSPQLADLVVGDESLLGSHRREIVVVFTDLRNFTPFAEASEPEEVMGVLGEYHRAMGALVHEYEGTLERFTGDGVMVFFNDPIECDDPAERALRMSIAIRDAVRGLAAGWLRKGHDLALGIGIAQGFATLGRIGFEGRFDYSAIGSVTNLAARLCGEATAWQVLVTDRILAATEEISESEVIGDLKPKGFSRSVRVHNIIALKEKST